MKSGSDSDTTADSLWQKLFSCFRPVGIANDGTGEGAFESSQQSSPTCSPIQDINPLIPATLGEAPVVEPAAQNDADKEDDVHDLREPSFTGSCNITVTHGRKSMNGCPSSSSLNRNSHNPNSMPVNAWWVQHKIPKDPVLGALYGQNAAFHAGNHSHINTPIFGQQLCTDQSSPAGSASLAWLVQSNNHNNHYPCSPISVYTTHSSRELDRQNSSAESDKLPALPTIRYSMDGHHTLAHTYQYKRQNAYGEWCAHPNDPSSAAYPPWKPNRRHSIAADPRRKAGMQPRKSPEQHAQQATVTFTCDMI